MKKTRSEKVTYEKIVHEFYCDECGKYIDEVTEKCGVYKEIGKYKKALYLNDNWYVLKRTLCDECIAKVNENIIDAITKVGFIKDEHKWGRHQ